MAQHGVALHVFFLLAETIWGGQGYPCLYKCRHQSALHLLSHSSTFATTTEKFPKALYGCEAATVNEAALRGLQNDVKSVMGPRSPLASNNMVSTLLSNGPDLDPEVNILQLRLTMIRRMVIKRDNTKTKIYKLLKHYTNKQHIGTYRNNAQLAQLQPAPLPHQA